MFIDAVRARRILPEGSKIIAAVSGGGDSVALVILLDRFSAHMNWELSVLHVDHGIRKDSSRDAAFVRALTEGMGLHCDVHVLRPPLSGSLEDFFSRERHRIYSESASNDGLVATGHTADDRAETLIMRMLEGSGPRGLGGMDYRGVGPVRRPLLDMTRKQLREYLDSLGQEWLADPTNREYDFLRNRIRHVIMPAFEEVSPGSSLALARSSANLSRWRDLIDHMTADAAEDLLEGSSFSTSAYSVLPSAIRLAFLWDLCGRPRGGLAEIEKTDRWITDGGEGFHDMPGGTRLSILNGTARYENSEEWNEG